MLRVLASFCIIWRWNAPYCREKHCQTGDCTASWTAVCQNSEQTRKDDALVELRIVCLMVCASELQDNAYQLRRFVPGALSAVNVTPQFRRKVWLMDHLWSMRGWNLPTELCGGSQPCSWQGVMTMAVYAGDLYIEAGWAHYLYRLSGQPDGAGAGSGNVE